MARLRTAIREWNNNGVSTDSGAGLRLGSARYDGKRTIRIDRIDSVSIIVSGGMSDYLRCKLCTKVSDMRTYIR